MQITELKLSEIIPYENNPRKNDEAVKYVTESIKQFGFKVPIVIDKNNVIVCGHTRYKAAQKLKLKTVPCILADDLTEDQIKAYRLADNKVGEKSEWDFDLLTTELEELNFSDIEMSDFGFDLDLEEDEKPKEAVEDDFNEEIPVEPKSQLGDIYQLGNHRLMCGDSTDKESVLKLMNGEKASISFTSPPYNVGSAVGYEGKKSRYKNDDDNRTDYIDLLCNFTKNAIECSKFTFVNIQQLANNKIDLIDYVHEFKHELCDTLIWDKGHGTPNIAKNVTTSCFEYIYVFGGNGSRAIGTKEFQGTVENIIRVGSQKNNEYSDIHNATFPLELPFDIISKFSNEEESILDLFGGTGTTMIACEQLKRKCYMMELDPRYVDVIINRWEQFTGEKAIKINA